MLLDEYDTPLQEAYVKGYWEELVSFLRPLFGTTFKGNPYLDRGFAFGQIRKYGFAFEGRTVLIGR